MGGPISDSLKGVPSIRLMMMISTRKIQS